MKCSNVINGNFFTSKLTTRLIFFSHRPMSERRRILRDRMTEIPNRIMLSEVHEVHVKNKKLFSNFHVYGSNTVKRITICLSFQDPQDLAKMIVKVLKLGLEGLVLKDINVRINVKYHINNYNFIFIHNLTFRNNK